MNKCMLSGRLTKDAELSYIASTNTPKIVFTIAVDRNYQKDKNNKKSDFINCEMLGKGAEALNQYLTKGKPIMVEGELNIDQYQDQEGNKKSFTKIKVDRVEFQQGSKEGNQASNNNNNSNDNFEPIDDGDIPF
ncbi:MAG: single-stranded DNA-binding protein [Paraclostridium sp.]